MSTARWSTVNAREAFAGVVTPLTYSFYFPGAERASARFWKDLGLLERGAADVPEDSALCFFGRFHGRMAINVDRYGEMADRTPGTSAAALEEQMFGVARTGAGTGRTRRRYPIVALVAPRTIWRARRDTRRDARDEPGAGPVWRREWLTRLRAADPATARAGFREARDRLETVLYRHIMLTAVAQGCFDAAAKLAEAAGCPGAENELVASTGGTDEAHMIDALHRVAAGSRTMASFLDEYGYHGPDEGHLEATVWRQDPAPLHALLQRYRDSTGRTSHTSTRERAAARERRTAEFLAALPPLKRPPARLTLRAATAAQVLREQGKALFLQAVDVGREAATVLGARLVADGTLRDPGDVYFLTARELLGEDPIGDGTIERRRAEHERHLSTDLPDAWNGEPEPIPLPTPATERAAPGTVVRGLGVSAGTATGRVRVVHDIADRDFDVDDVLVCRTTDPSWASLMAISTALVIDVGGAISHGAIVARELGIPCVIGTGDGTRVLSDGDTVRVDGGAGTALVLESDSGDPGGGVAG